MTDAQTRGFDIQLKQGPRSNAWAWLASGIVVAAGVAAAGYFILKPAEPRKPTEGSLATFYLQLPQ